jgi:UTP--glucose-1-phosphate uridylyltransferase
LIFPEHAHTKYTFHSDWQKVSAPAENQIVAYEQLPQTSDTSSLKKLVVLKVNGGLGTTMGERRLIYLTLTYHNLDMDGAKSALEVQNHLTFLDIIIQQVEHLNATERVEVPLLFMTSFNTEEDTLRIVKKYANRDVKITTFNQSRYPRITNDSLLPLAKSVQDEKASWYPPGHGDLYNALHRSGVLDRLIAEGKEYLFIANSDNLGAMSVSYSNL